MGPHGGVNVGARVNTPRMPNQRMGQQQVGGGQRGMKFTPSVRNPPVPPPQSQVPQTQPDLSADYHPQQNLLASLTQSTPQQQKQIIGEHLYREIYAMYPDLAVKITGMLLEMDNSELLHMLEVPESLKRKVEEAVDACMPNRRMGQQQVGGGQCGMKFTPSVRNPPVPPPQSQVPQTQPDLSADYHPQQNLLASLTQSTPQQQKQIIGEHLYREIYAMHPDLAGKITGMLLEMDNSELLHMLEVPESLKRKVEEAVDVLREHQMLQLIKE